MKADRDKLIETLKKLIGEEAFNNFEVYVGEINGTYDVKYNIEKKDVLDNIFSDGEENSFSDHRDINDAGYVCVVRYKNKENKREGELEKIFLFLDENSQKDFMFDMVQKDPELYQLIFDSKNYRGNVSNYKDDNSSGFKIVPSKELIESNKNLMNKGNPR